MFFLWPQYHSQKPEHYAAVHLGSVIIPCGRNTIVLKGVLLSDRRCVEGCTALEIRCQLEATLDVQVNSKISSTSSEAGLPEWLYHSRRPCFLFLQTRPRLDGADERRSPIEVTPLGSMRGRIGHILWTRVKAPATT